MDSDWHNTTEESYSHFFTRTCPYPPEDTCTSESLTGRANWPLGNITTRLQGHDFRALSYRVSDDVQLNITSVERILSSTGPVIDPLDRIDWQWVRRPKLIKSHAETEQDYYGWLEWVLFRPATHAVSAVRDTIYRDAALEVPQDLLGVNTTESILATHPRGVTDILHSLRRNDNNGSPCVAHEVKRSNVLGGGNVLGHLVELAARDGGCEFRKTDTGLGSKVRLLLWQCIDELILYHITHIILTTPEQYVLLFLDDSRQFRVSRLYTIRGSTTQAADMAELVLFYTHALFTRREPYPPSPRPSTSVLRVTVPEFSPRFFQPEEALLCEGALIHKAKLAMLGQIPGKTIRRPLPVQFHASDAAFRHDGDIIIFFGRLVFWFLEARVVAKAAYQSAASDRLLHEFAIYEFLRGLQGVVIPSLFGMYRNLDDGSSILLTSYAGVTLKDFDTLSLEDRRTLLMRVACLHKAGVLHNDLEPRNVVLSRRLGPRVIDFDNATMDHTCGGMSCEELSELSRCLGLDLGAELSRATLPQPTHSWLLLSSFCLLLIIMYTVMHNVR